MVDRIIYARQGEDIVCEAGHVVTRPTRDLCANEAIFGDMLEGMDHLSPGDPARGILGDDFPPCSCGERWFWFGALRFREGYRTIADGALVHRTLQQVYADWQANEGGRILRVRQPSS